MGIAKVTAPTATEGVVRPRLFARLAASAAPVAWIAGPPGAGKTTLVATWLREHRPAGRLAWLNVDPDDADPAVFFRYLALAVESADPSHEARLPLPDPAQQGSWLAFARRFAREAFAVLGDGGALVLDNVQCLAGQEGESLLESIAGEVPDDARLFLLSHAAPPPAFAALAARRRLLEVDAEALRFDAAETAELHQSLGERGGWSADDLHAITQGWAAGVVLLANTNASIVAQGAAAADHPALFHFFATAVARQLPARCREVLSCAALMNSPEAPRIDALLGGGDARHWLEHVRDRGLFVERRGGAYALHPLFRTFLRNAGAEELGEAAWHERLAAVAGSEFEAGQFENAVRLLVEAGRQEEAAGKLIAAAPGLARAGRLALILGLLDALGEPPYEHAGWLEYWRGVALSHVDEALARGSLESAYAWHAAREDAQGRFLAAAAIAEHTVQHFSSFRGIEYWRGVLNKLHESGVLFEEPDDELRAITGVLAANLVLSEDVQRMEPLMRRCEELVRTPTDPNQRMAAASFVLTFFDQLPGQHARAAEFIEAVERVAEEPGVTELRRATWLYWLATYYSQGYKVHQRGAEALRRCRECLARMRAIGEANGFMEPRFTSLWLDADLEMFAGNLDSAGAMLEEAERFLQPMQPVLAAHYYMTRAHLAIHRGDARRAAALARHGIEIAEAAQIPEVVVAKIRYTEVQALAALGEYAAAIAITDRVIAVARPSYVEIYRTGRVGYEALRALAVGEPPDALLARFFGMLREQDRVGILQLIPHCLARLCAAAIARSIEVDHVRRIVRERGLEAPPDAPAAWPWRVALRAFGGFEIAIDGTPLRPAGKSKRRPLELLEALAARGEEAFAGVNAIRLAETLWPDLETEDNRANLHTTVHRARKLLGFEQAVVSADGRLALDRRHVWCDAAAFQSLCRAIARRADAGGRGSGPGWPELARDLLALARGPFLDGEEASWAAAAREKYRAELVRAIERCALALEAEDEVGQALALYEEGLRQDPLVEAFYRAQMRLMLGRGERAEALRIYRRCREMLSLVLGTRPASETEILHKRALEAA